MLPVYVASSFTTSPSVPNAVPYQNTLSTLPHLPYLINSSLILRHSPGITFSMELPLMSHHTLFYITLFPFMFFMAPHSLPSSHSSTWIMVVLSVSFVRLCNSLMQGLSFRSASLTPIAVSFFFLVNEN